MHSFSSKQFRSKAICQSLINTRLITADQAYDLVRREGQIREAILAKASSKKMTPMDKKKALAGISFIDVILHLKLNRLDKPEEIIDEDDNLTLLSIRLTSSSRCPSGSL